MRRPRAPKPVSPYSGSGDSSQKTPNVPPTSNKYFPKVTKGGHESKGYKVGRKHSTEAY